MVETVGQEEATYQRGYMKFKGTPNIADVVAGSAFDYLDTVGCYVAHDHNYCLTLKCFSKYFLRFFSTKIENCGGVLFFTIAGVHPHDATIFDGCVAIRRA